MVVGSAERVTSDGRRTPIALALVVGLLAGAALADLKAMPDPEWLAVRAIAESPALSKEQKLTQLVEKVRQEKTRSVALWSMEQIDSAATAQAAMTLFREQAASREMRLTIGHFLLTRQRFAGANAAAPAEFVADFARFLCDAVGNGGEAEFCRPLPEHPLTAVGEYAYLASDFDGYHGIDFAPFHDARLIPVLIACLQAPDNVYAQDQGCVVHGKPGESTGRNTARQQIPVALAKLNARAAIDPLRQVLRTHHDWYERDNAAYALARLTPATEHADLITELRNKGGTPEWQKGRYYLYAFGRGLLDRGDDAGIEFMSFEYSTYHMDDTVSGVTYMLEERLTAIGNLRSPKVEAFVREALDDRRVLGLLLMDGRGMRDDPATLKTAEPRIVALWDRLCQLISANKVLSAQAALTHIAADSRSKAISTRAKSCLAQLGM